MLTTSQILSISEYLSYYFFINAAGFFFLILVEEKGLILFFLAILISEDTEMINLFLKEFLLYHSVFIT